jgi:hypothetical protein
MSDFIKYDDGKAPMHLLPPRALRVVAQTLGYGAEKYDDYNWVKCDDPRRFVAAALRHISHQMELWQEGADGFDLELDDESLLPSLAHAAASVLLATELMLRKKEEKEASGPSDVAYAA